MCEPRRTSELKWLLYTNWSHKKDCKEILENSEDHESPQSCQLCSEIYWSQLHHGSLSSKLYLDASTMDLWLMVLWGHLEMFLTVQVYFWKHFIICFSSTIKWKVNTLIVITFLTLISSWRYSYKNIQIHFSRRFHIEINLVTFWAYLTNCFSFARHKSRHWRCAVE